MFAFGQYWTSGDDVKFSNDPTIIANLRRELGFEREKVVAERSIEVLADASKAIKNYNTELDAELATIATQSKADAKKLWDAGYPLDIAEALIKETAREAALTRAKILKLEFPMVTDNDTMIEAATGVRPNSAAVGVPGGMSVAKRTKAKATKKALKDRVAALNTQLAAAQGQLQIAQGPQPALLAQGP